MNFLPAKAFPLAVVCLFLASQGLAASGGKKYPGYYRGDIRVDGNSRDWDESLFRLNKSSQVYFALANDSSSLYFCVKIKDEAEQRKMIKGGMFVWIDARGKKTKETGIHYPMGIPGDQVDRMTARQAGQPPDPKTVRLMLQLRMQDMDCIGFRGGNGIQNHKNSKSGIVAALEWDSSNILVCEAMIPLKLFREDLSESVPFTAGIQIKGSEARVPRPQEGGGAGGNEPVPGNQGMPGEEGNRGMDGRRTDNQEMFGSQDAQRMSEDDIFWLPFVIAKRSDTP